MRRSHMTNGQYAYSQEQTSEMLETENESLGDALSQKVKALKTLSIDIGDEVRDQVKFLNSMDSDFDNTQGFLGKTMKRVQIMAKSGHNRYILYLLLFSFFVFFVIWLILKTR